MSALDAATPRGRSSDDIAIEPMRRGHVADVVAIERRTFDSPWTEGMFRQEVSDGYLSRSWVAVRDGTVVGYLISWFLREEVHLLNVAVDAGCRGRGYGRRLVKYLLDQAVQGGRDVITLEVRESNAVARRLYESFGFATIGRRKGYYQDNHEDAIVMILDVRDRRDGGPA